MMEQTLVLNVTYEPLKVVDWQRAVVLWCQGKVEIVETHDREIRSVTFTFRMPSIVRLLRLVRVRRAKRRAVHPGEHLSPRRLHVPVKRPDVAEEV